MRGAARPARTARLRPRLRAGIGPGHEWVSAFAARSRPFARDLGSAGAAGGGADGEAGPARPAGFGGSWLEIFWSAGVLGTAVGRIAGSGALPVRFGRMSPGLRALALETRGPGAVAGRRIRRSAVRRRDTGSGGGSDAKGRPPGQFRQARPRLEMARLPQRGSEAPANAGPPGGRAGTPSARRQSSSGDPRDPGCRSRHPRTLPAEHLSMRFLDRLAGALALAATLAGGEPAGAHQAGDVGTVRGPALRSRAAGGRGRGAPAVRRGTAAGAPGRSGPSWVHGPPGAGRRRRAEGARRAGLGGGSSGEPRSAGDRDAPGCPRDPGRIPAGGRDSDRSGNGAGPPAG